MSDSATRLWGADWDTVLTNPPEYPSQSASRCIGGTTPAFAFDVAPSCSYDQSELSNRGNVVFSQGTRSVMRLVVNQTAAFPDLITFNTPLVIPSLHHNFTTLPAELSIDNSMQSFATVENEDTLPISLMVPGACKLILTNTSCTAIGHLRIPVEARGSVWFNYPSLRDGHFKWPLSIEGTITDIDQRSTSHMLLGASMASSGTTGHTLQCLGPSQPSAASPKSPAASHPETGTRTRSGFPIYAIILIQGEKKTIRGPETVP
ncbi:hypothetical protein AURDEDRAFT_165590 [Auricularia subglabra TFB-10046 SS5]|nr:hypothetical protein AURDEDRAFT_165590 [Auricularia subglabra TFB-10046 SS5]